MVQGDRSRWGPMEMAAKMFSSDYYPRIISMDFSLDGNYLMSAHQSSQLRLVGVTDLVQKATIDVSDVGLHLARFTQSSGVACMASCQATDGHLYLLDLNKVEFVGAMSYVRDEPLDLVVCDDSPAYSAIAQSPCNDTIAALFSAGGQLLLFHPLVSGAVGASAPNALRGRGGSVAFSPEGTHLAVCDDAHVHVYDYRKLLSGPLVTLPHEAVGDADDGSWRGRCIGAEFSSGGREVLLTYEDGKVLLYDLRRSSLCGVNDGVMGASDHNRPRTDVAARFLHPFSSGSPVAQLDAGTARNGRLLIYEGCGVARRWGSLRSEILFPHEGEPVAMCVNPEHSLLATATANGG